MPADRAIHAVVFDLDGLMFNTEDVFEASGDELLRRRGHRMTPALRDQMMGRRAVEAFQIMIDEMDLADTIDELRTESQQIFAEFLPAMLAPMPGLFDLLEELERRELPKGVATSSSRQYLHDMLGRFDLVERFDVLLGAEDVSRGKPEPEVYLKAAEQIGVDPTRMLVLEDSQAGTQAGAAAGAVVVSIPHVHSNLHDFRPARAIASSLIDPVVWELLDAASL